MTIDNNFEIRNVTVWLHYTTTVQRNKSVCNRRHYISMTAGCDNTDYIPTESVITPMVQPTILFLYKKTEKVLIKCYLKVSECIESFVKKWKNLHFMCRKNQQTPVSHLVLL